MFTIPVHAVEQTSEAPTHACIRDTSIYFGGDGRDNYVSNKHGCTVLHLHINFYFNRTELLNMKYGLFLTWDGFMYLFIRIRCFILLKPFHVCIRKQIRAERTLISATQLSSCFTSLQSSSESLSLYAMMRATCRLSEELIIKIQNPKTPKPQNPLNLNLN